MRFKFAALIAVAPLLTGMAFFTHTAEKVPAKGLESLPKFIYARRAYRAVGKSRFELFQWSKGVSRPAGFFKGNALSEFAGIFDTGAFSKPKDLRVDVVGDYASGKDYRMVLRRDGWDAEIPGADLYFAPQIIGIDPSGSGIYGTYECGTTSDRRMKIWRYDTAKKEFLLIGDALGVVGSSDGLWLVFGSGEVYSEFQGTRLHTSNLMAFSTQDLKIRPLTQGVSFNAFIRWETAQ